MDYRNAPEGRTHSPILTVDYKERDNKSGYGDAEFIDIGRSTWNKDDWSAKLWRKSGDRWSRQSEELPLSRALDLAILIAGAATGNRTEMNEFLQHKEHENAMKDFLTENMRELNPRLDELRRILEIRKPVDGGFSGVPNIFSIATSELSQDAMFTWLLSWADPRLKSVDGSLNAVALNFLRLLTGEEHLVANKIETGRQWSHIDVWAEINDDAFLIIEDKTGTSIHDNQLERYKKIAEKEYPNRKRYYAYVKTGNEPSSILREVQKVGYKTILRKDIIKCLETYTGDNMILCSYRECMKKRESDTQSFLDKPVQDWSCSAWEGFYSALDNVIDGLSWGYVSNPSGGFLGAWWHFQTFGKGEMYLQFEQGRLCVKICPSCERDKRVYIRNMCANSLMRLARDQHPEIKCPNRFGAGAYMTIAVVDSENVFGTRQIKMEEIIAHLKEYERLIDKCCGQIDEQSQE